MRWREEIDELHEFFEAYFLGTESGLDRFERVLAPEFVFVGPDGAEVDRAGIVAKVRAGHAHTDDLRITVSDHRLIREDGDLIVATYVERHRFGTGSNQRRSMVAFVAESSAPNGLQWLHIQETWLPSA